MDYPFSNLPDELVLEICQKMDTKSLINMIESNSRVYQVCSEIVLERYQISSAIKKIRDEEVVTLELYKFGIRSIIIALIDNIYIYELATKNKTSILSSIFPSSRLKIFRLRAVDEPDINFTLFDMGDMISLKDPQMEDVTMIFSELFKSGYNLEEIINPFVVLDRKSFKYLINKVPK